MNYLIIMNTLTIFIIPTHASNRNRTSLANVNLIIFVKIWKPSGYYVLILTFIEDIMMGYFTETQAFFKYHLVDKLLWNVVTIRK